MWSYQGVINRHPHQIPPLPRGRYHTTYSCICGVGWSTVTASPSVAAGDLHCPQCGDHRRRCLQLYVLDADPTDRRYDLRHL